MLSHDVRRCLMTGVALFYSICTPCIFQELFCKQMMYFSMENNKKNSTIPQLLGFFPMSKIVVSQNGQIKLSPFGRTV